MNPATKKRYGQHFLRDTGIINRIAALIGPAPGDLVLEVGGGDGALSTRIAPHVAKLMVLEIDRDLEFGLREALSPYPKAELVMADVLQADLTTLMAPHLGSCARLRIVGNLPYNIGTAIIERLLTSALPIEDMIFMLQLEAAERIGASPGSRDYGYFTVFCSHFCDIKLEFKVSPACFVPRPKVESAMITLRPRRREPDPERDQRFVDIAKAAFAYRRKKLANALKRNPLIGALAEELLHSAGIDGSRRAEDLRLSEYEALADSWGRL
jgi:16S rRNA (adenine1518-N6/adenine1519-N6)-dimethyltransferase